MTLVIILLVILNDYSKDDLTEFISDLKNKINQVIF